MLGIINASWAKKSPKSISEPKNNMQASIGYSTKNKTWVNVFEYSKV
jgi:hypothetical protein